MNKKKVNVLLSFYYIIEITNHIVKEKYQAGTSPRLGKRITYFNTKFTDLILALKVSI